MKRAELERMRDDARAMRELCQRVEAWCSQELDSLARRVTRTRLTPPAPPAGDVVVNDTDRAKARALLGRFGRGRE